MKFKELDEFKKDIKSTNKEIQKFKRGLSFIEARFSY